jgi:hypothetical protein
MKKLAAGLVVGTLTLASSSAAFADEINTDVVTTEKQQTQQTTQTPATTPATTSADANATVTTQSSTTTTTSAPIATTTSGERESYVIQDKRRPNKALLITGGSILVSTYLTTVIAQAANDGPDTSLYIPVAGPWLHLADRNGTEGRTGQTLLIGASGVLQGVGAVMTVVSFLVPEKHNIATISAGPVKMAIGPGVAAGTF